MRKNRFHVSLDLTGVIVLIAGGVLVPVMLLTAAGIVALAIARDAGAIVTGVLVVSFAVAAAGSALLAVVMTARKSRLARLQADFVAAVTHEFRTPLSAIRLYAQTLQSGRAAADPVQAAACLATILRETERLDALVERALTWRAAATSGLPLHMQVGPVAEAVAEAAERFRASVAPGEVAELACALDTRLAVSHDPAALGAVVLNLLTNAQKYTGRDKRIAVAARDEGGGVVIEVRDNGIGMTPRELRHVFQPFYRTRHAQGGPGGVGLGLAIARQVVHGHGGTIEAASTPGVGSVFTIRLPAAGEAP